MKKYITLIILLILLTALIIFKTDKVFGKGNAPLANSYIVFFAYNASASTVEVLTKDSRDCFWYDQWNCTEITLPVSVNNIVQWVNNGGAIWFLDSFGNVWWNNLGQDLYFTNIGRPQ